MRWYLCAVVIAGCSVGETYRVEPRVLDEAARLDPPTRAITAVAAERLPRGTPAWVRADKLVDEPHAPDRVRARAYSPMVTAGSALTWIGTAISVAGTILYFAAKGDTSTAGAITAASAEPIMLTGTLLWIFGALRHPQEIPPGRAGTRYLARP